MLNKKSLYIFLLYSLISIVVFFISLKYINNEKQSLLEQKYNSISNQISKTITTLIKDKQNATLVFALSVARDDNIKNSLIQNDISILDLNNFSKVLKQNSKFKNIWFQIINKDGNSFYRSWTKDKNDSLLFRKDIQNMLKNKKIQSTISVGRYDMTFKSMIPIFYKKEFLGIFEIISHFNSISKILEADGIQNIFLAHKKYTAILNSPFSKKFLDKYYIANLNAKEDFIKEIKNYDIEKLINSKNYLIINNKLINSFKIKDKDELIGFAITAQKLSSIDISNIIAFKKAAIIYVSLSIIIIGFIIGIINYSLYSIKIGKLNKKLKRNIKISRIQKKKNQMILDSQKNIIIITDGEALKKTNKALFKFFTQYRNIKEFKKEYQCICETFIEMNDENYVTDKDYDGKNWAEFILENSQKNFKAAIKKDKEIHHFTLNVALTQYEMENKPYIIVTLTEITDEVEQQKLLKNLNENLEHLVDDKTKELKNLNESLEEKIKKEILKSKEKDSIIFQQNKMVAIAEMLSNIAHQWRQPLNCISTAASSIQLHQELGKLDETEINNSCEYIINYSQYLSKTIDDFKNFFKQDSKQQNFLLIDIIKNNLEFLKERFIMNQIKVVLDMDKDFTIFGYKNEFQQAILNILNNSYEAFLSNKIEHEKLIIIHLQNNCLTIKDSANGVDEKIINKIFEPYFTTKHQSQGTGLSLYMTREILVNHENCTIEAFNSTFTYESKEYTGLEFIIRFKQ